MLQIVEPFFNVLKSAATEDQLRGVLEASADRFGFRSAMVVECGGDGAHACMLLDTCPERRRWWDAHYERIAGVVPQILRHRAECEPLLRLDAGLAADCPDQTDGILGSLDLAEGIVVPITRSESLAGYVGFSGPPALNELEGLALYTISVNLFVQCRLSRAALVPNPQLH